MIEPSEDAYGQEIYAAWQGQEVYEIVERDDGYIDPSPYNAQMYFSEFKDWHEIEKKGIAFAGGRVLDVGCGAGRVALYLQDQGHAVVGIDNSPLAVEVCRQRGVQDVRLSSVTNIGQNLGIFDTVVMFGNNFGLFGSMKRARWLLRKFQSLTSPAGRIIATTLDPYKTENPAHLEYHAFNRSRGRMGGQVRIRLRFQKFKSPWFDYLFVSREEMNTILDGTGWKVLEFIDQPESPRYFAVIEKG